MAANVRRLRTYRGWSQGTLATELGLPATAITRIEKCARSVTVDELFAFAAVFGVTIDQLVTVSACDTCNGCPPPGFTCNACGTECLSGTR